MNSITLRAITSEYLSALRNGATTEELDAIVEKHSSKGS
jgi:hypothetical protein